MTMRPARHAITQYAISAPGLPATEAMLDLAVQGV